MEYIIFDLEWSRYARRLRPRCPDEIIQIGAVKYNEKGQKIDSFNRFIRPSIYKVIDSTVQSITGITMDKLKKDGVPFSRAIKEFRQFIGNSKNILMAWGSYDAVVMKANCIYYNKDINLSWLSSFVDLQKYAGDVIFSKKNQQQTGLAAAADELGIFYTEDNLHDALVDASLSGEIFSKILDEALLKKYIVDGTKISVGSKSIHITDLSNPMINRREFMMRCPLCGRFVSKQGVWAKKNKRFVSTHFCKHCSQTLLCSVEVLVKTNNEVYYKKRARLVEAEKKCPKAQAGS